MADHAKRLRMLAGIQEEWAQRAQYPDVLAGYRADAAALLAGAEALELEEWRPIETAPHERTVTIEMHDPQGVILRELADPRVTQESVALTYAFIMRQLGDNADWPRINAAIRARWKGKTALARVKEMAWKRFEQRTA